MRQKKSKNETSAMSTKTENRPKQARKNGGSKHLKSRPHKQRLSAGPGHYFIWGYHAVCAALSNPNRIVKRFYASPTSKELAIELAQNAACRTASEAIELVILEPEQFEQSRDMDAKRVHQNLMVEVQPLEMLDLSDILFGDDKLRIIVLDQITDSRNVGAIIRSCKAFGCNAIIVTKHNAPSENGSLARAAAGALEDVPIITVTNLNRAMETLKSNAVCCIGLDASGEDRLDSFRNERRLALIMGAEGAGMRRLTKQACDNIVTIPMRNKTESLNVSVASAIALYVTQIQD
mgnify:FL=1